MLFGGDTKLGDGTGSGNITLSQPWRNFDALLVYINNDNGDYTSASLVYKWQIELSIQMAKAINKPSIQLVPYSTYYWMLDANKTTDTILAYSNDNCRIQAIYGVTLKGDTTE